MLFGNVLIFRNQKYILALKMWLSLKLYTRTCIYKYGIILFNSKEFISPPFDKEHSIKELLQARGSLIWDEKVKSDQTVGEADRCVHLRWWLFLPLTLFYKDDGKSKDLLFFPLYLSLKVLLTFWHAFYTLTLFL